MFCICTLCLCREWRLIEVDATLEQLEPHRPHLLQLLVRPVTHSCRGLVSHVPPGPQEQDPCLDKNAHM